MLHDSIVTSFKPIHHGCHEKEAITEEAKIMASSTNNPNEPQKLNDEDLTLVNGRKHDEL